MKTFGIYTKIKSPDTKRDLINSTTANTVEEAISIFAEIKHLNKDVLLDIFEIKEIIKS
jgi:hypothetical protein